MKDEVLELLDDIMENGEDIPSKVSNRLLLAAIRKNYRVSMQNSTDIVKNYAELSEKVLSSVKEQQKGHDKLRNFVVGLFVAMFIIAFVVSWHTGVDFGWWPPITTLP